MDLFGNDMMMMLMMMMMMIMSQGGFAWDIHPSVLFLALSAMEKTLKELETIWADMNFDTQHHDSSGETLLVARDELIEQLEGDQVQ